MVIALKKPFVLPAMLAIARPSLNKLVLKAVKKSAPFKTLPHSFTMPVTFQVVFGRNLTHAWMPHGKPRVPFKFEKFAVYLPTYRFRNLEDATVSDYLDGSTSPRRLDFSEIQERLGYLSFAYQPKVSPMTAAKFLSQSALKAITGSRMPYQIGTCQQF